MKKTGTKALRSKIKVFLIVFVICMAVVPVGKAFADMLSDSGDGEMLVGEETDVLLSDAGSDEDTTSDEVDGQSVDTVQSDSDLGAQQESSESDPQSEKTDEQSQSEAESDASQSDESSASEAEAATAAAMSASLELGEDGAQEEEQTQQEIPDYSAKSSQELVSTISSGTVDGPTLAGTMDALYTRAASAGQITGRLQGYSIFEDDIYETLPEYLVGVEEAIPFFQAYALINRHDGQRVALQAFFTVDETRYMEWMKLCDEAFKQDQTDGRSAFENAPSVIDGNEMEEWAPPLIGEQLMSRQQMIAALSPEPADELPRFLSFFGGEENFTARGNGGSPVGPLSDNFILKKGVTQPDGSIKFDETPVGSDTPNITNTQKTIEKSGNDYIIDLHADRPYREMKKPLDVMMVLDVSKSMYGPNYFEFLLDPDAYGINNTVLRYGKRQVLPDILPAETVHLRKDPGSSLDSITYEAIRGFRYKPVAYRKTGTFKWDQLTWVGETTGELEREITVTKNGNTYTGGYTDAAWTTKYKISPAIWTYEEGGRTHYVTFDDNNPERNLMLHGDNQAPGFDGNSKQVKFKGCIKESDGTTYVEASVEAYNQWAAKNGRQQLTLTGESGKIAVERIPIWMMSDSTANLEKDGFIGGNTYARHRESNRLDALKIVAKEYIQKLAEDGVANSYIQRIGAVKFSAYNWPDSELEVFDLTEINIRSGSSVSINTAKVKELQDKIGRLEHCGEDPQYPGSTYPELGLELAAKKFDNASTSHFSNPIDRSRYKAAILLCDGEPTNPRQDDDNPNNYDEHYEFMINAAQKLKDRGATIYSIFLGNENSAAANRAMNFASSNMSLSHRKTADAVESGGNANWGNILPTGTTEGWTDIRFGPWHSGSNTGPVYENQLSSNPLARGYYDEMGGKVYDGGLRAGTDTKPHDYYKHATDRESLINAFAALSFYPSAMLTDVIDYIDPRFEVIDADGGTVMNGGEYIIWASQSLGYDTPFNKRIVLRPKENYLGGNNVYTNGENSGLHVPSDEPGKTDVYPFPRPTTDVDYKDKIPYSPGEDTNYVIWGDELSERKAKSTEDYLKQLFFDDVYIYGNGTSSSDNTIEYRWERVGGTGGFPSDTTIADGDMQYKLTVQLRGRKTNGQTVSSPWYHVGTFTVKSIKPTVTLDEGRDLLVGEKLGQVDPYDASPATLDFPAGSFPAGTDQTIIDDLEARLQGGYKMALGYSIQSEIYPTTFNSFAAMNSGYTAKMKPADQDKDLSVDNVEVVVSRRVGMDFPTLGLTINIYKPVLTASPYYLLPGEPLGTVTAYQGSNAWPKSRIALGLPASVPATSSVHTRFPAYQANTAAISYTGELDKDQSLKYFAADDTTTFAGSVSYNSCLIGDIVVPVRVPDVSYDKQTIIMQLGAKVKEAVSPTWMDQIQTLKDLLVRAVKIEAPTSWGGTHAQADIDALQARYKAAPYKDALGFTLKSNSNNVPLPASWDDFGDWYARRTDLLFEVKHTNGTVVGDDFEVSLEVTGAKIILEVQQKNGEFTGKEKFVFEVKYFDQLLQKDQTFYEVLTINNQRTVVEVPIGTYSVTMYTGGEEYYINSQPSLSTSHTTNVTVSNATYNPSGGWTFGTNHVLNTVSKSSTKGWFISYDNVTNIFN